MFKKLNISKFIKNRKLLQIISDVIHCAIKLDKISKVKTLFTLEHDA